MAMPVVIFFFALVGIVNAMRWSFKVLYGYMVYKEGKNNRMVFFFCLQVLLVSTRNRDVLIELSIYHFHIHRMFKAQEVFSTTGLMSM